MKKLLIIFSLLLVTLTGCGTNMGTPTKKVEEFLGKYQSMDSSVLTQLDSVIASDKTMSDEQKKEYKSLMERQYQNLSYKIKSEDIDGDRAEVVVEVEVYDYATSINKSKNYYNEHKDEFLDDTDDNDNSVGDAIADIAHETSKFIDYKIKQLKDVTDKSIYEIKFYLSKDNNGEWVLDNLTDIDRQKLHGLYEG